MTDGIKSQPAPRGPGELRGYASVVAFGVMVGVLFPCILAL